ncbi:glucodextranase-like protein [Deinococcus yavapaiensis KR-236]|uniref:Glucodextranase-like protein n=2 Tax=Deinococcus TaxID=1298 RepID=A0A318SJL9_9DEIO|nr:glucodextranase-like protein [Deinococcus yavapaiensis KR-236]
MPFVAAALLTITDPAGDTRGDGSYTSPPALVGGSENSLDIRELRAENVAGRVRIVVGLGGVANPWNAPSGWSSTLIDVFVKTSVGGEQGLADTGFVTPPGDGWQRHYQVSGFRTRAWHVVNGETQEVSLATPAVRRGTEVSIDTDLPARSYSYWVTSRIYSPLTSSGFLTPRVAGGSSDLLVPRAGMPSPVDVLLVGDQARAYITRILPPGGQLRDRRSTLLLILAVLGVLAAVIATFRAWRRT